MILPGKHLKADRALLGLGAEILEVLEPGHSVSELWERMQVRRSATQPLLSFDWYILCLALLYTVGAIEYEHGVLTRLDNR